MTAAFGAASTNILNLIIESRGVSWSVGAQRPLEQQVTVPSILKGFNPKLVGSSMGNGGPDTANAGMNVAISGAVATGMPGQARTLVDRMRSDPDVDFEKDWKLVTIWIGGNDLCAVCNRPEQHSAQVYGENIRKALDEIYNNMPRTFVNVVSILDVTQLGDLNTPRCTSFPGNIRNTACGCGTSDSPATIEFVREMARAYQQVTEEVVNDPKWTGREDFAAVVQPFFIDTEIPRFPDGSYDDSFFGADCFHFSERGHAAGATALWNNMLQPVGQKSKSWVLGERIQCPTEEQPYLFTNQNSQGF